MKKFEIREIEKDEIFDPNNICGGVPFTQASFYGDWQENLSRVVKRFIILSNNHIIAYFQLIKYPLLLGKSYLYIPYGPVTKNTSDYFLAHLKLELKRIAKAENAVFVRLDFTPFVSNSILQKFFTKAPFYTYHSAYFQPRVEWFLSLEKSDDNLLAAMHTKTRYSIRLAERKGITAEIIKGDFEKYFENFYELMLETAKRNGFSIHQKNYYESIFQNLDKTNAYLSIAKYGQKILSIKLVIVFGKIANYVFGGSSNEERNRMPTYLAQWQAICYAKKLNCDFYNFGGINNENKVYNSWNGLTIFKKKFGGKEVLHSDFFDVVINPLWYQLYNFRKLIKKINS